VRPIFTVILLSLLTLPLFFWNLTDLGLFNTQEAIRVNVAREMQRTGEWLVPVRRGEVYIAKPPMVYWCQIGLAKLRGVEVGEFELRLNAAIWGWLGVMATYFAARRMLGGSGSGSTACLGSQAVARDHAETMNTAALDPAFWSAAILAAGVLYSQSARVGEIDVMLVAPVVTAIACMHASWRHVLATGKAHWGWVLLAALAACIAAAVKGPAGLMVIALGGSVPTVAYALVSRATPTLGGREVSRRWWAFKQLESTHPLLVIGLPLVLLWLWLREARLRVGDETFAALVGFEASDNLNWFDWGGMVRYAEAVGVSLGVFLPLSVIGLWWVWRSRREMSPGRIAVACWFVLGLLTFAVTTKGVGRYLTPVWPAIAMLAGLGVVWLRAREKYPARLALVLAAALVAQAGSLACWHAFGRTTAWAERSPREFMREVLAKCDPSRLGTLGFNFDAFDFYADQTVETWGENRFGTPVSKLFAMLWGEAAGSRSWKADQPGAYTLLVLEENPANRREFGSAAEQLLKAGLTWEEVPMTAVYRRPPGDARVLVWRVAAGQTGRDPR
jgi:4-amino-4-deoxy-L-arabinose transferase-like glycosyltransferase